jgi:hypothetical protein
MTVSSLRLKVQRLVRQDGSDDPAEQGARLVAVVRRAIEARGAPTVAVVVRPEHVDLVQLRPVISARASLPRFLGALTQSESPGGPVEAVGLMGTVRLGRPGAEGPRVPAGLVFLEWADCRWWHWQALLDAESASVRTDTETIRSAVDGDPLPAGIGRWWSLGRRLRLRARFSQVEEPTVVH